MRSLKVFVLVVAWTTACNLSAAPPPEPQGPPPGPVSWPQEIACGADVDDVVATVSSILQRQGAEGVTLVDAAERELVELAGRYGGDVIACLVDLLQREWTRVGLSASPERAASAQRAQDFLARHGVTVTENKAYSP